MINSMRGFVVLPLIIILVIVGSLGVGWYTLSHRQQTKVDVTQQSNLSHSASPSSTLTPTPTPTQAPVTLPKAIGALVDCVGPDGKHISLTQSACDTFKKSWATPTPSPANSSSASVTGCASYNLGGDLGTLTVNIQAQSGQSLVGDAGVTISRKYSECKGVDPGFPLIQIIRQGSTSTTFSGMRPGPFHIDVGYHGNTSGQDVGINSGSNSTTVTVSN